MTIEQSSNVCEECGTQIAPGLLSCPGCSRLVYRARLNELAAEARSAEEGADLSRALANWRGALELLPPATMQHATITRRMQELSAAIDGRGKPSTLAKTGFAGKAATAGALALTAFKSKALLGALFGNAKLLFAGLLKLPTLLSMLVYAQWSSGSGLGFGLGLVGSIYVHEIGHVAALRRYGIAASAPMFVPGLGAFVRLNQYPTDAHEEARTGLAGPLWGLAAAFVAYLIGKLGASVTAISVASAGATLNLFNLIPVWFLDGSRGLRALNRTERVIVGAVAASCAVLTHQWMPGIVAVVAFVRAYREDSHPTGDRGMLALFVGLVVTLSVLATLPIVLPGR